MANPVNLIFRNSLIIFFILIFPALIWCQKQAIGKSIEAPGRTITAQFSRTNWKDENGQAKKSGKVIHKKETYRLKRGTGETRREIEVKDKDTLIFKPTIKDEQIITLSQVGRLTKVGIHFTEKYKKNSSGKLSENKIKFIEGELWRKGERTNGAPIILIYSIKGKEEEITTFTDVMGRYAFKIPKTVASYKVVFQGISTAFEETTTEMEVKTSGDRHARVIVFIDDETKDGNKG